MTRVESLELVAAKPDVGSVSRADDGRVQVVLRDVVLRLHENDYWMLMEMLSDAARRLADAAARAGHRVFQTVARHRRFLERHAQAV